MKRKLLFVIPNQRWQKDDIVTVWDINPRFLCVLGAMVKDLVDVEILDCQRYRLSPEDFAGKLAEIRPDFVGISLLTSEYKETLDIGARIAKATLPDVVVLAGGVHVTLEYREVIANPDIDYACRGEGEYVLRDLLNHLLHGGPEPDVGWVWRRNGEVVTGAHAIVEDLSALPFPDYDLVTLEDYLQTPQRYGANSPPEFPGIPLQITRGCPCPCTFCQVSTIAGKRVRTPSAIKIVEEIERLKERYGIRSVSFWDDNFFMAKAVAKDVLRLMIERKVNLKWTCPGFAIFVLDDEFLDLFKRSGCTLLNIAIESGNERVLKSLIKKPIKSLEELPHQIATLKQAGIDVVANFIIGYPGESWDEIMDTIHYAEHCGADYVKFFVAVPLKGTVMYDMALELGALETGPEGIRVDWRTSQIHSDEWGPEDVSALRVYEWDRINFSRARIANTARLLGVDIEGARRIRKQTRDALHAAARARSGTN